MCTGGVPLCPSSSCTSSSIRSACSPSSSVIPPQLTVARSSTSPSAWRVARGDCSTRSPYCEMSSHGSIRTIASSHCNCHCTAKRISSPDRVVVVAKSTLSVGINYGGMHSTALSVVAK
jgi:hypothetical protein